jgi:hypothetical protein
LVSDFIDTADHKIGNFIDENLGEYESMFEQAYIKGTEGVV